MSEKEYVGVMLLLQVLVCASSSGVWTGALATCASPPLLCAANFIPFGLDTSSSPVENDSIPEPASFIPDLSPASALLTVLNQTHIVLEMKRIQEAEALSAFAWEVEFTGCVVVLALALWFGFNLGAGRSAKNASFHILTPASTTIGSPDTLIEEPTSEIMKKEWEEYPQSSCPEPDLPSLDLENGDLQGNVTSLHLENGRLEANFKGVEEIWRDCRYRYYTATHILEGQRYILKETTVPLSSMNTSLLADFHCKSKSTSKYILRYVTCWAELASSDRVKVIIQIEYFTRKSLLDVLLTPSVSLSPQEICRIYRQIVKGMTHLQEANITNYPLSPASIYIDDYFNVKLGDFELTRSRKTCRSLTLDGVAEGLQWHRKQLRSLGVLLYQLLTRDENGLADLMENHSLPEDFQLKHPLEAQLILTLTRQPGSCPSIPELLKSQLFLEWSESVGVRSPVLAARAVPESVSVLSLIKVL